jgi:hypothetical protein
VPQWPKTLSVAPISVGGRKRNVSPRWVKLRRTQYEHMFSALPSNSDIARRSRHVSNVPTTEVASHSFDNSVREGEKGRRYIQAKRSCRLQIDDELELCGLLDG